MFKGKGTGTSRSARAQAHGRAELQRQLEERLIYWRLFLEAKLEEVHERRNPAGLQEAPVAARAVPVERAGTAARAWVTPSHPIQDELEAQEQAPELDRRTDDGIPERDPRTDDGALDLAEEDA